MEGALGCLLKLFLLAPARVISKMVFKKMARFALLGKWTQLVRSIPTMYFCKLSKDMKEK